MAQKEAQITTLHPHGKKGANISKEKYELIKSEILAELEAGPKRYTPIADAIAQRIEDQFDGRVYWYVTTVKLDLEARGLLRRVTINGMILLELVK